MYEKIAMKRHEVESSNIKSIGHSYPRRLLEIEFKDGNIYRYKGVNHKTYRALMNAESKGKEFHKNIKYSFPYKKYKDKEGNKMDTKYEMLVKQAYEDILGSFEKGAGFYPHPSTRMTSELKTPQYNAISRYTHGGNAGQRKDMYSKLDAGIEKMKMKAQNAPRLAVRNDYLKKAESIGNMKEHLMLGDKGYTPSYTPASSLGPGLMRSQNY